MAPGILLSILAQFGDRATLRGWWILAFSLIVFLYLVPFSLHPRAMANKLHLSQAGERVRCWGEQGEPTAATAASHVIGCLGSSTTDVQMGGMSSSVRSSSALLGELQDRCLHARQCCPPGPFQRGMSCVCFSSVGSLIIPSHWETNN